MWLDRQVTSDLLFHICFRNELADQYINTMDYPADNLAIYNDSGSDITSDVFDEIMRYDDVTQSVVKQSFKYAWQINDLNGSKQSKSTASHHANA